MLDKDTLIIIKSEFKELKENYKYKICDYETYIETLKEKLENNEFSEEGKLKILSRIDSLKMKLEGYKLKYNNCLKVLEI